MNMFKILLFFIFVVISCRENGMRREKEYVSFSYNKNQDWMITLPGVLNDTLPLTICLETGAGTLFVFSDSLKSIIEYQERTNNLPTKIQIGNWVKNAAMTGTEYYIPNDSPALGMIHPTKAFVNWQFFDGKIIKISYDERYLQELETTENLSGYDKLKITRQGAYIFIPISLCVQGKRITENIMFDTGSMLGLGLFSNIGDKYGLSKEGINEKTVSLNSKGGENRGRTMKADTLWIGSNPIIGETFSLYNRSDGGAGFIGNYVLRRFTIVLDLIDDYCYLKKNNE